MLESLLGLIIQTKVANAQITVQQSVDSYYTEKAGTSTGYVTEISYDVSTRGEVLGSKEEFRSVVAKTLADERGWQRAQVKFTEKENDGRMHMILASPKEVATASAGCSEKLSCTVGAEVLINDERWRKGSDSYNKLGVALEDYRYMVINHEVGHFLGHSHISKCETGTGLAPIMLEQSKGLLDCKANAWPLPSELWIKGF